VNYVLSTCNTTLDYECRATQGYRAIGDSNCQADTVLKYWTLWVALQRRRNRGATPPQCWNSGAKISFLPSQ